MELISPATYRPFRNSAPASRSALAVRPAPPTSANQDALFRLLVAASSALALPATTTTAFPTPTVTCATSLTPQLAHFDDLPPATGRAHAIRPSPSPNAGVYQKLYYGNVNWYVTSSGYQQVPWLNSPTEVEVAGNMTVHSGQNAIINQESVPLVISTYYDGDYFNLDSLWVRSLSAASFLFEIRCFVYNAQGSTTAQEIDINIPAVPTKINGGYHKVQLTSAQKSLVAKSHECLFGDKNQTSYTLMDDIQYCYYHDPTKPF